MILRMFASMPGSLLKVSSSIVPRRGLIYSSKKGVSRDWLAWIQQPLDLTPTGLRRWIKRKEYDMIVSDQKYQPERREILGPDLATAQFIVARDGAVKFSEFDRWIRREGSKGSLNLPSMSSLNLRLEAVNLSRTNVMFASFDNFVDLKNLKYMDVSYCQYMDDWCLDRLVDFRDSLLVLDISGCPQISERGIASLHRLHKLVRLKMSDMSGVKHGTLVASMLEQVLPDCVVEGATDRSLDESEETLPPLFVRQYDQLAGLKDNEKTVFLTEQNQSTNVLDKRN